MNLTPAARALRLEIIARPGTLFAVPRPYRALARTAPGIDPQGDAAHLVQAVRDETPTKAQADAVLAHVAASLPRAVLRQMDLNSEEIAALLIASRPHTPVYA